MEVVGEVEDLRARHDCGLVGRKVGREQFVELSVIDIGEPSGVFFIACDLAKSRATGSCS
jgi:hypothetical protein